MFGNLEQDKLNIFKKNDYKKPEEHFLSKELYKRLSLYTTNNNISEDLDNSYIRVSEFTGGCERKLFYRLIYNKIKKNINNFRTLLGTALHEVIQNVYGDFLSHVEERFYDKTLKITGQVDGVFLKFNEDNTINEDFSGITDIKTVGLKTYNWFVESGKIKKDYKRQLIWYTYLFNKTNKTNLKKVYLLFFNRNIDQYLPDEEHQNWVERGLPEFLNVFEIKLTQEEIDAEINSFIEFRKKIDRIIAKINLIQDKEEIKKIIKKERPNKIPKYKQYLCNNCEYHQFCFKQKK